MELADRVKLKRQELEMSQDELARRMGYKSRSSINKIEMGRPVSQKIIVKLAESLNVTPAYLMGWEDDEREKKKKKESIPDIAAHDGFGNDSAIQIQNQVEKIYITRTLSEDEIQLIKNYRNATQKEKNIVLTLLDKNE